MQDFKKQVKADLEAWPIDSGSTVHGPHKKIGKYLTTLGHFNYSYRLSWIMTKQLDCAPAGSEATAAY